MTDKPADSLALAAPQEPDRHSELMLCDLVSHWFIQGGEAQFGPLRNPLNADEFVAQILSLVRKQLPAVSPVADLTTQLQALPRRSACQITDRFQRWVGHDDDYVLWSDVGKVLEAALRARPLPETK